MKSLSLFTWLMFIVIFSKAQWEPDVRLTNDPNSSRSSYNFSRSVTASGDTVHVVWQDNRDGNNEIYYNHSINGGITWGQETRLTFDIGDSRSPSISVTGVSVHIVWDDSRDGQPQIYYKHSTDGGNTWGDDTRLTYSSASSFIPTIVSSESSVDIVWYDNRSGYWDIYYKRSNNSGLNWGPDIRLTDDAANSFSASLAISGSDIHVVWTDYRDGNAEVYFKHSSDGGENWGEDTRLTYNTDVSRLPCAAASGSVVYVVWQDMRDGDLEIYYKRSEDNGLSWGADTRLTVAPDDSQYPSIAVSGLAVHVVWNDNRDGNHEVYYKRSEDGGINWGSDTRLTNNLGDSQFPNIAVSGSIVHLVWTDLRDGNEEIYYKRDPTGGFPVGTDNELAGNFDQQINIYPNPAIKMPNIIFNSETEEILTFKIIDMTGRIQGIYHYKSLQGINHYSFDLADLRNGIYFIELITGSQRVFKKFVINK